MAPPNSGDDQSTARQANELYWKSERSVNAIAEDLGLSKGRLYNVVKPLESGIRCPECDAELVHANRTAREQGLLSCPDCEFVGDVESLRRQEEDAESLWVGSTATAVTAEERARTRLILGGVLLGTAAGALLVGYLRRR